MDELEQALIEFVTEKVPGRDNVAIQRTSDEKIRALANAIRSEINSQITEALKRSGLWD